MARALLVMLSLLGTGRAAFATGPVVPVYGGGTWGPSLEVALDEVALIWTEAPRRTTMPPSLIDGTSIRTVSTDAAAIRVDGVTTVAELVARGRALRDANPGWDVRLVLYHPGAARSSKTRRLLTGEIVVTARDGTVFREHAADPLSVLDAAALLRGGAEVVSAEPVAEASDYLKQRLKRKLAKLQRQDRPDERQEFFALKRRPPGEAHVPVERYLRAREHMTQMPLRSTITRTTHPPAAALGLTLDGAAAVLGGWTPLGPGNVGGRTRALVVDPANPQTLYAGGVAGGVWKTTNGGAAWTPLTDTLLPNIAIASLAMDPTNPSVLYAGTGEGVFNIDAVRGAGIFKTTDGGATWSRLSSTTTADFFYVNRIVPLSDTVLLAATRTGVWRSVDAGGNWTKVIDGVDVNGCFDVANAPSYVLAVCGSFSMGSVYRSVDAGATFVPVIGRLVDGLAADWGMGRSSIAIAASNPDIAYVLASNSNVDSVFYRGLDAVYKSTDGGLTWIRTVDVSNPTKLNTLLLSNPLYANLVECGMGFEDPLLSQGWYDNVIAVDPTNPDRVWAGGIDLFRSDDGGFNWKLASFWWTGASPGAYLHADQHAIVFAPDYATSGVMYVGNDGGVFKTTNGATADTTINPCTPEGLGITWTELNNGYGVTQFYHGLPYPGDAGGDTFFGGTQDNGTIRGAVATGPNAWAQIFGGDGGYVAIDAADSGRLYVATPRGDFWASTDGGATFAYRGLFFLDSFIFIPPLAMSPNNSSVLWTGSRWMWRTTDATVHWSPASNALAGNRRVTAIAVAPGNDNVVMAATEGGFVFRTDQALTSAPPQFWGGVWPGQPANPIPAYVSSITFDPRDANTVYLTYSTFGVPHVWKSTDGAQTWVSIDGAGATALPDVPVHTLVVDPGNPFRLFVGTDVGVFSSEDGGANWAVENTGFANAITEWLALGKVGGADTLFAFTHGRGAWRVTLPLSPADIGVTAASVPHGTDVVPGGTVTVSNTVTNFGQLTASAPFVIGFGLVPVNASGIPAGADIPLAATRLAPALAPKAASAADTAVVVPASVPFGSYRIKVIADGAGVLTEDPNAVNNVRLTNTLTVAPSTAADLEINASGPTLVEGRASTTVTFTVTNNGPGPATNVYSRHRASGGGLSGAVLAVASNGATCRVNPTPSFGGGRGLAECRRATLAPHESYVVTLTVADKGDGPATVDGDVQSDTPDSDPGNNSTSELSILFLSAMIATCTPPIGEVGVSYDAPVCNIAGGWGGYTCRAAAPLGLTVGASCRLAGTATSPGTKSFTVNIVDMLGVGLNASARVTILPAVAIPTVTLAPAAANRSYSRTLVATGGQRPYTWSVAGGSLPDGMWLTDTGQLAGRPTATGISKFTLQVMDIMHGRASRTLQLVTNLGPLTARCSAARPAEVGVAYAGACAVSGGLPPYSCAIAGGALPAGLALNGDCSISGTPTKAGSSSFTTRVSDSGGLTQTIGGTVAVVPHVSVTTSTLPNAPVNRSYVATLTAAGGRPPFTWSVAGGTVPTGVTLNAAIGTVTGIPTSLGISTFTVRATDALGGTAEKALRLVVNFGPFAARCALGAGEVGVGYHGACAPVGGLPPFTCALVSGNVSAGLALGSDCSLIGMPGRVGTTAFGVRETDAAGATAVASASVTIVGPVRVTTSTLPAGRVGTTYRATLAATAGRLPYTWSVTPDSAAQLPAGLVLNPMTGTITGTATVAGNSSVTFRVSDGLGGAADKTLPLVIAAFGGGLSLRSIETPDEVAVVRPSVVDSLHRAMARSALVRSGSSRLTAAGPFTCPGDDEPLNSPRRRAAMQKHGRTWAECNRSPGERSR